ncbi:uncharacterized protein LOC113288863 [Papaver somniferum]|uniref:uncharacterized protein LOC113288863 n=1 Tax=Papaver somniferum TaxID=3469 RepID=UPI000E700712|nr:uncharacterized protein LOC113288863 [Papaver somniferum]XP_026393780.1 uncharacterized protein LOC113288863 [Papaver somniferum]
MVDTSSKKKSADKSRNKKRKVRSSEENERDSEPAQIVSVEETIQYTKDEIEEEEEQGSQNKKTKLTEGPYRNLELISSLQKRDIDNQRKLELALEYVNSWKCSDYDGGLQIVSDSHLIKELNKWVQSLLIVDQRQGALKCWEIFKFCLEKSLYLQVPLSFKQEKILRGVSCVGKNALLVLEKENSCILSENSDFYSFVFDSVALLFTSHGRAFSANMDVLSSTVRTMVDVLHKVYLVRVSNDKAGVLLIRLSCFIFEYFANFLRVHPSPKKVFPDFLDKLLEPLLSLLVMVNKQIDNCNSTLTPNLLKTVEDILSYGLFHSAHVKEFLSLQGTDMGTGFRGGAEMSNRSYCVRLFERLEKIISEKRISSLGAVGELFRLFVVTVKRQKGVAVLSQGINMTWEVGILQQLEKVNTSSDSNISLGNARTVIGSTLSSDRLDMETGKAVYDIFLWFIKPLKREIEIYNERNLEQGVMLLDAARCTLEATNKIIAGFMHQKVYLRTEDTSDGERLNFLKGLYQTLVSFSSRILHWLSGLDNGMPVDGVRLIAKEIIVALGSLLEIEYEVAGEDLVILWKIMLSYLAVDLPVTGSLSSHVLHFGRRLINIYSELRQVSEPIFALCKAVRLFWIPDSKACVKSVTMLLCFQEFRLAVCKAIKNIPEGQASGFIKQLEKDVSDSLVWMKTSSSKGKGGEFGEPLHTRSKQYVKLQAELLGRALCEVYSILLDNLAVTTGNSIVVGNSIQDLVKFLGTFLSILVRKEHPEVGEFLSYVTGQSYSSESKTSRFSASWISVFFFRIYTSCRSLFRELISLMPPEQSKKASKAMGDLLTAYSGDDCMERAEGYFSWIIRPSDSPLTVIKSIEDFCGQETVKSCAPLVYVMHSMACQRLADLSQQIDSYKFLQQEQNNMTLTDDDTSSLIVKEIKTLRKEAKSVTKYITKKVKMMSADVCIIAEGKEQPATPEDDAWDLCILSLNEYSLPTAVWYLLCQSTDIWGPHATKKKLKMFLRLLFHIFQTRAISSGKDFIKHKVGKSHNMEKIAPYEITIELLHDSLFHEQTFLCRNLPSCFSDVLKQSLVSIFGGSFLGQTDINEWKVIINKLEKASSIALNRRHVADNEVLPMKPDSLCPDSPFMKSTKELLACRSLLNLLAWMPKGYLNSESFSDCATNLLNLERVLVVTLLQDQGELQVDSYYELFRLFVSCRKAFRCLLISFHGASGEAKQCSISTIFSGNSYAVLWLWKSVTALIELLPAFPEEQATEVRHLSLSLMDDTSYILSTLTKEQFRLSVFSAINNNAELLQELPISDGLSKNRSSGESYPSLGTWMEDMMKSLEKHADTTKASLKTVELDDLSSLVTSIYGFLWGINSTLQSYKKNTDEHNLLVSWLSPESEDSKDSKLKLFIASSENFINSCLHTFFVMDSKDLSLKKNRSSSDNASFTVDILIDSYERLLLKKPLSRLLKGDNPKLAACVRQLLIGSSAILSLKRQIYSGSFFSSSMPVSIAISQYLLTEFTNMVQEPHSFSYICLDGVVKYLKVLGSYVSKKNSLKNVYARLIGIHLQAIGRCISLCGKEATLASHDTESSTKTLMGQTGSFKLSTGHGWNCLNEFRDKLRLSFNVLVTSKLHLETAIKAVERALVGVSNRCSMGYEICTGGPDEGKVSAVVAAGVDCFDSVIESVSGRDSLPTLQKYIQSLTSAVFNIVVHLRGPQIFYSKVTCSSGDICPDPGAVILMCAEVLTKVAGKPALFQLDSSQVVQCLRLPAALFQDFCYLRNSLTSPSSSVVSANEKFTTAGSHLCTVDQRFSVDLFATCCRLLSTVLRHQKREIKESISILQYSASVLLCCLVTRDMESVDEKGYYTWEVQEGRKCASFFCRIYEEIKQQKDVFERYTLHFLSNYIWIYSGLGLSKTGIRREIDEALRPGVYALVDAHSEDDLQYLHTVFDDGPCTGTLKTLVQDYKQNYKYGGKV